MRNFKFIYLLCIFTAACALPPKTERTPSAVHTEHQQASDEVIMAGCDRAGWSEDVDSRQQKVINEIFGNRDHRLQHALWHAVRSGLSASDESQVTQAFGPEWSKNHPLCPPPKNNPGTSSYNPVGEDFLYMHHHMVMALRAALLDAGLKCIKPWTTIPDPKKWPLPDKSTSAAKTADAYEKLREWDAYIQSTEWLRKVSLSQLGWALEFTIHNNLHMRYATERPAAPFRAVKAGDDGAQIPMDGHFPGDWNYDNAAYNWLADPYGAALNARFWKIHGYVDLALKLWLQANQKTRVELNCPDKDMSCYQWSGEWIGNLPDVQTSNSKAVGSPRSAAPNNDKSFNRQRLALQRLGVLTKADFPERGGPVKAMPPHDLLDVARARVCPEK